MKTQNISLRPFLLLGFAAAVFFLSGCVSNSKSTDMVALGSAPVTKHAESVSVNVANMRSKNLGGVEIVTTSEFAEAVKTSITQSGLFAKIAPTDGADYGLDVQIVRLDLPMMGFAMTATMEVNWRLAHRSDGKVVWERAITLPFTAHVSDAFAGATQVRLAAEGAVRANIKDAIAQMGALTLP